VLSPSQLSGPRVNCSNDAHCFSCAQEKHPNGVMITWIPYTGYGTVEQREKTPRNESFTQRQEKHPNGKLPEHCST
jgi:hypothetical protein